MGEKYALGIDAGFRPGRTIIPLQQTNGERVSGFHNHRARLLLQLWGKRRPGQVPGKKKKPQREIKGIMRVEKKGFSFFPAGASKHVGLFKSNKYSL